MRLGQGDAGNTDLERWNTKDRTPGRNILNHRQMALAAMRGRSVDRIPFIARMDLWYSFHRNSGTAPGDRFILGFGDNVPTDALFTRIQRTAQYWAVHGSYPLQSTGGRHDHR